jgi:hypothetical protein
MAMNEDTFVITMYHQILQISHRSMVNGTGILPPGSEKNGAGVFGFARLGNPLTFGSGID